MQFLIRIFQWLEKRAVRVAFIAATLLSVISLFVLRSMSSSQPPAPPSPSMLAWAETRDIAFGLRAFHADNEQWPEGDASKICAMLRGDNPTLKIYVGNVRRDATGVFVDPWGMPYRIDLTQPDGPRIHSFGSNQRDDGGVAGSDDIVSWR